MGNARHRFHPLGTRRIRLWLSFFGRTESRRVARDAEQDPVAPLVNREAWHSVHAGCWHTGESFLAGQARAMQAHGETLFDTLSVMDWDSDAKYVARSFESNGFEGRYDALRAGTTWMLLRATERATSRLSDNARACRRSCDSGCGKAHGCRRVIARRYAATNRLHARGLPLLLGALAQSAGWMEPTPWLRVQKVADEASRHHHEVNVHCGIRTHRRIAVARDGQPVQSPEDASCGLA